MTEDHDEARIAAYIQTCSAALEEQAKAANGWPEFLVLPEPETPAENEALGLFLAKLREATGAKIAFRFATKPH